jgi:sugar lactone lactonase YvrE
MRNTQSFMSSFLLGPLVSALLVIGIVPACAQSATFTGVTPVGQSSVPITVTVNMTGSGVAAAPSVVTQSVAGGDFVLASGGTCSQGTPYSAGQQCTAAVQFKPQAPGVRVGAVVILDGSGKLLGETNMSGVGSGPLAVLDPGNIMTVAGDADWTYRGDNVPATAASIFLPTGVVVDAAGNMYISDSNNNRVRRVDAVTGMITTFAGNGVSGYSGDGGAATSAEISNPAGLAMDGSGNLYFADTGNQVIRRIDAVSGLITTIAGVPSVGGYVGDGGAATKANLSFPEAVVLDTAGNLYISDTGNNVVRVVNASGVISTFAGTGAPGYNGDGIKATTAALSNPWGLAVGVDNSLYIADMGNNAIRKVGPTGIITTVAGSNSVGFSGDGGPATSAQLKAPAAIALDPAGNMYIADSGNNRVRKVSAATGIINTICGTSSEQYTGDGETAAAAGLYGPYALYVDAAADLFIADLFHNRIREISATQLSLTFPVMRVDTVSMPTAVMLANDGNTALQPTQFPLLNAALDVATTNCSVSSSLLPGNDCTIGAEFAPKSVGNPIQGTITVDSNAGSAPQGTGIAGVAVAGAAPVISLSGQVLSVNPTTISISSSANPSLVGASVTFSSVVSGSGLTGTVVFLDGSTQLCSVALASQSATCVTSTLSLGTHSITAQYSGDTDDAASTSAVLSQVVKQQSGLTLSAAPNPATVGTSVTITFTAIAPTGTPTGSVVFYDGATTLGHATLSSGSASISTTSLAVGTHSLTATYSGDASNTAGSSNAYSEVIQALTTLTQLSTSNPNVPVGTAITFTATVGNGSTPPTGTVTFKDGSSTLGSGTLNASGVATLTVSTLAPGVHSIVAVYGGDSQNGTSQSAALSETVTQIATTTTLAANTNPINAGATLQLTASVSASAGSTGGAIGGNVTFSEGATTLGAVAVDANGNAVLNLSTLSVGSHSIIATYAGNTNYTGSASAVLIEIVQQTGTTITLSSAANPTLTGEPVNLTVTLVSSTGVPTGSVNFLDGGVSIGTSPLNAKGIATFSTSTLTTGTHTLTAVYSGDSYYTTSTSQALQQVVSLATTGLTISAPTTPVNAGVAFSVSGILTGNGVAPTGTVSLMDGSAVVATHAVTGAGPVSFTGVLLPVGSHSLTLVYSGDTDNAKTTSAISIVIVQQGASTEALTASTNPQTQGQSVTFTATVTSASPNLSGSISFMDGSTLLATVSLNASGVATYSTSTLTTGSHLISATYAGDANHTGSNTATLTELIVEASTASLTSSLNPAAAGNNVTFTAKITGSGTTVPTGSVTFMDGATLLGKVALDATGSASLQTATLAVGSHTISVTYPGDTNYFSSNAQLIETIQGATTQITLTASANPATYGQPVSFAVSITSNGSIATGSVDFTVDGASLGTAVLNSSGVATLTTSSLTPGNHTIVANYAGDGKASASSSVPLKISVLETTAVVLSSSADPATTLSPITLIAVVNNSKVGVPTGTVTFSDGGTQLGTAILDATGTAALNVAQLSAGSHNIVASYAGDVDNFAGTSPSLTQTVTLRPTSVTLSGIPNSTTNTQSVLLIGVVHASGPTSASGTITFTQGTQVLGTVAIDQSGVGTLAVVLQTGTNSIVATYAGDTNYAGSASQQTVISGGSAAQFSMVLNPATMTLVSKQHSSGTLSLTSVAGYTDTMEFGCLGLPFAATCTFSSPTMVLPANGTINIQVTVDTGNPLGSGSVAGNKTVPSNVLLCLLPAGLLLGFGLRRKNRRNLIGLTLMLFAIAVTISATGCGGLQTNGTPAGTYSFKVTASGQGTGVTQSQVMTLKVTQ